MSMCRVFSCVVGIGCLLWPVCSLGRTLLAFALLHFILQGQTCLLFQVSWLHTFASQSTMIKGHLFLVLLLEGLVGHLRTVQLQLLQHYLSGHRLGLLWYLMVCLGNEQRSFCCFWDCIQVLHLGLFCWPWWLLHGMTHCGPLEKGMANHFSILALRSPWTVWKGQNIGHWKMNSPGW